MTQQQPPVVQMRGIVKTFPGVVANAGVDFGLLPGEVHALLGENGAGKSTLMNVLYGLYHADEGEIFLRGRPVHFSSARDAIANGLGMVHQHFMLIPPFTVAENIVLGQPSPRAPLLESKAEVYKRLVNLSERYGLAIDPGTEVWTLSVGEQQRVEILKTLYRSADIIILDEPTAVLTPQEIDDLLKILDLLTAEGKSIVFISHKLDEVLAASDRITVLRDGHVIDTVSADAVDKKMLARMMVGRDVVLRVSKPECKAAEVRLALKGLEAKNDRGLPALRGVSFEVRSGEILGVAGVAGNGQSELEEVICGLRAATAGQVLICGQDTTNRHPHAVGLAGLAHIPSDRYKRGLLKDFAVADNLVLQRISEPPFTRHGRLNRMAITKEAERLAADFDVRTPSLETVAGKLSGGNAQKMILAREMAREPRVLIAAQPTRGLDVSAIEYVHRQLIEQRNAGMAILLISSEMEEILTLSDRIVVMFEGEVVGTVSSADADINEIGLMMAGSTRPNNQSKEKAV